MKYIITSILEDVKYRVEVYNTNDTDQLKDRKVINIMKRKRNRKRGTIKESYNSIINQLEKEYSEKYS